MKDANWNTVLNTYDNETSLLGIDTELSAGFSAYLKRLNPVQQAIAISRLKIPNNYSRSHRALFEKHFHQLPKHIKEGLSNGDLRLSDHTIYAIKQVKEKSIHIFEKSDEIVTGICNVKEAELPKNMVMLACDLQIMAGISVSEEQEDISATSFGSLSKYPALLNGEYQIRVGEQSINNGNTPLRKFLGQELSEQVRSSFDFQNPFLIPDGKSIDFEIKLGSIKGLALMTFLWVGLNGICTIENNKNGIKNP